MGACDPISNIDLERVLESLVGRWKLRNRALIVLQRYTGFRISEALSLRLSDVVVNGGIVKVVKVARRNMKQKRAGRAVPLHNRAATELKTWLTEFYRLGYGLKDDFVFQCSRNVNQPISRQYAYQIFNRACRKIGLEGTFGTHSLRKSFADSLDAPSDGGEKNLRMLQAALGHASINSTIKYVKPFLKLAHKRIMDQK
jgi:integrase